MPEPGSVRESSAVSPSRRTPAWGLTAVAYATQFLVVLDVSVINLALPQIRSSLSFDAGGLQWVITSYMLAFGGFLLLGGRLADLYGRRRVLLAGLVLFALASLLAALAWQPWVLIAARTLQGLGAAVLSPVSLTLLTTEFPEGRLRTRALAVWGGVAAGGGAAGVLIGGFVTQYLGWRWTLLIGAPIAIATLAVAVPAVTATERSPDPRPDVLGAALATGGLTAVVYALASADLRESWWSLAVGAALLTLFGLWEVRWAAQPLLPASLLRVRAVSVANGVMFLTAGATFSMWYFLSLFLQREWRLGPLEVALAFLPQYVAVVAGSQLAPRALAAYGPRKLLVGTALAQAVGFGWLSRAGADGGFLWQVLAPGMLVTLALGLASAPMTTTATGSVPRDRAGVASGLINTSRHVGGAVGVAGLTLAVGGGSLTRVFAVDSAILTLVAALALAIPRSASPQEDK